MRTAITFSVSNDGTARLISGPEKSAEDQRAAFNTLGGVVPEGLSRIELWHSDGRRKVLHTATVPEVKQDEPKRRGRPPKTDA